MKLGYQYERMCLGVCEHVPKTFREKVQQELIFAGIKHDHDSWIGRRIILVALIFVIGLLLPPTIGNVLQVTTYWPISSLIMAMVASGMILAAVAFVLIYLNIYYQVENRANKVEEILPDFLGLVANNLNAGMTPFLAFRNAARKEFEPLSGEIKNAVAKSLGTQGFSESLEHIQRHFKSQVLRDTVSFFSQALRSGGHLVQLLESTAQYLRQTQEMRKELQSGTKMYIIFVVFVVLVATPLLLSVAVVFLQMINQIQGQNVIGGLSSIQSVSFLSTQLQITPEFMQLLGVFLLVVNAILSSLFIGVLSRGKAKWGARYIPGIFLGSMIVFFAAHQLLARMLGV